MIKTRALGLSRLFLHSTLGNCLLYGLYGFVNFGDIVLSFHLELLFFIFMGCDPVTKFKPQQSETTLTLRALTYN